MRKLFYYVQYIHEITKPTNTGQVVLQLTDSINCAEIIVKTVLNLGESQSSIERCILRVLKRFRMKWVLLEEPYN